MRSRLFKWGARSALVILVAVVVWVMAQQGGKWLDQIRDFTWQPVWLLLAASVALLGLSYYFLPFGWAMLSASAGSTATGRELRAAWFISQLGRYLPGKIWLFAGRAAFLKSNGMTGYRATSVPFLELLYTAAGAGLAALPAVLLAKGSIFEHTALKGAVIAAGLSILLIPFLRPLQRWLYRLKHGDVPGQLPLPDLMGSLRLLLFYALLWWVRGLTLYLWIAGFGIRGISFPACFAAAPLSWLAGYIVFLVPGGIGVREAVVTAMLAGAGQTGPVLAVIAGQRLILSVYEVSFALMNAGRARMFGRSRE